MFGFFKDKIKKFLHKAKETEQEIEKEKQEELKQELKKELKKEEKEEKKGFFSKLKEKFSYKLNDDDFDKIFSELELVLIESNVALEAIDFIKAEMKRELLHKDIKKGEIEDKIKQGLTEALDKMLIEPFDLLEKIEQKTRKEKKKPYTIVFFGINGSGKTTTIAKLANYLHKRGYSCVLAAADTFRAAAIDQLEKHADKLGVKIIKQQYGSDPAAVAFDAIAYAKAHGIDVVLVDTAGRMHTQSNLMQEMEKIVRVSKPDLKIFIGEAIIGNDAVEQAKMFNDKIGIEAIILSKADIDEKAGATISVSYVTKKPILFLGMGQEYSNIEPFDKGKIIKALGL